MNPVSSSRSQRVRPGRALVVGAGMAGSATALRLCELGVPTTLMSLRPARHSPSAALPDGISAVCESRQHGDSPEQHLADALRASGGLAHPTPLKSLVEAAPVLVQWLDWIGVAFERSESGQLAMECASGHRVARTAHAGDFTSRSIINALDDQLERWENTDARDTTGSRLAGERMLVRLEYWELLDLVRDEHGQVVGVVGLELHSGRSKAWPADAVCLATGGYAGLYAGAAASPEAEGTAQAIAWRSGAVFVNAERVQFEPTTVPLGDRAWLLGDRWRSRGARIWVSKLEGDPRRPFDVLDPERDYPLDGLGREFGGLPPADQGARALAALTRPQSRGSLPLGGGGGAFLDLRAVPRSGPLRGPAARCHGDDPWNHPWPIAARAYRSLGGLWVDHEASQTGRLVSGSPRNHSSNLAGLYVVGQAACEYHGACQLGGHAWLESLHGGLTAAEAIAAYRQTPSLRATDLKRSIFERAERRTEQTQSALLQRPPTKTTWWTIRAELGHWLAQHVGIERNERGLQEAQERLLELSDQASRLSPAATTLASAHNAERIRRLEQSLVICRLIVQSALWQRECRGVHDEPERDPGAELQGPVCSTLAVVQPEGGIRQVHEIEANAGGQNHRVTDSLPTPPHRE
ncbi:FAD-binding protein [Myxococcota bacterium]